MARIVFIDKYKAKQIKQREMLQEYDRKISKIEDDAIHELDEIAETLTSAETP